MIGLGVDHSKALDHILQAANKHPNSRVSKLIHSVEEERSQKNIVLLLIELAEHAEYATDFSISLKYYLDLFEKLGIEREIVLNEAGLLLLNSSKVYARRVDFVQELVERQILTLSNADKEIVENGGGEQPKNTEEKPKRTRKRLVATIEDPFEVELVPRKFRKLTEEKRFVSVRSQEKQKMVASRFYKIDSEQYIHPAAWTHACIVDLENEEDIDSKRNYKLFTYHVEHRYNTLVTDINFRMHFKVKDYIDEEEERLERNDDSCNSSANILKDWPPLSEEYVKKYLDLENKALAVGEVKDTCEKLRIDREDDNIVIIPESVQNHKVYNESNIECNQSAQNTAEYNSSSIQCESGVGNSINESNVDLSTKSNETTVNEQSEFTINSDIDLSVQNIMDENSCLNQAHNLNSTEKSILELSVECENTFEASGISLQNQLDYFDSAKNTLAERTENDTGLGASITNESRNGNDIKILNKNTNISSSENADSNSNNDEYMTDNKVGNNENEINLNKIRVYLPHLDDEGVYFSDLDDQEHRMLSPRVVTTDVFPCIPNKKSITIIIDDEIRSILNIADEEPPPTYTMPIQVRPSTPPINLNIFKFHEKLLRRRILFKLGPEMELFLQSHSMKKSTCMDVNEQRQYRPMKLFNESQEVNVDKPTIETDNDILSDGEDMEDFLGFTEEEQLNKNLHRLSRDSGVDADVALTTNVCEVDITCDDLNNISQSKELISTSKETLDKENSDSFQNEFLEVAKQIPDSQNGLIQDITCEAKISTSESENSTNELTSNIHISANNITQHENEASSPLLFEDVILCTDNVQELQNSKTKIQKWHEYLQPILSKARDRHHFDVFQLGTEIMNELQKPEVSKDHIKASSITFQDMMANKAESYVSRYFLSTLLLKSEFDFLEWSPLNDRMLMIPDDWTNDTLFSSINGPFPFPDPREIARGAGIADFIQPGLGSLQPNIDDIDLTIDELLQPNRLPPVPEEGTDEMLKNVEYNLSAIMGSDQLESNSMVGVVGGNNSNTLPVNDDANMLDLNAPLDSIQFQSSMVQRYPTPLSRENSNNQLMNTSGSNQAQTINTVDAIMTDDHAGTVGVNDGLGSPASTTSASSSMRIHSKHFPASNEGVSNNRSTGNEFPSKSVMKGRISKNSQRIFRREPHNYDKAQPTLHQTTIYQQMLAEHQKSQQNQHLQPTISCTALQHHGITYHQQQQQQQQMQSAATQYPTGTGDGGSGTVYGGYGSVDISASANSGLNVNNNLLNVSMVNQKSKGYAIIQTTTNCMPNTTQLNANNSPHTGNTSVLLQTVKTEPPSTDMLSMYNLSASNEVYGINTNLSGNNNSNAYKPYPSVSNFKKSASTGGYINVRVNTNSPYMHDQTTNAQQVHQQSLPLNSGCQVTSLPNPLQLQVQAQCQLSPSSSHQHQQQPQQCSQHLLTTQQQHQMQQLSQQQQQQQQQPSVNMMPREMIRSNSLPLNVTLQKLESRSSHDNFVVPKYQAKNNKPRSRSNSIHQHSLVAPGGANKASSANNSNLMVSPQLQSATSDPMLNNSTLAQLLTTSSRSLHKKQSSSSSAISSINVPMPAISMPAVVVPPPASSTITVNTNKSQNIGNSSTSANYFATSGTSTDSSYTRHSMQMHQEQLQKSPKKCTSLPTPAAPQMLHSPPCSKMLSYPPTASQAAMCTNILSLSPESFHDQDSPLSPTHSLKFPRDNQRRAGHIHAEQKRRYNIKNGFDLLHSLIPQLQQNPNAKLSKAAMLQKGADHIKHLRAERNQLKDHMEALLKERDILNNSLTHLHSILPANGAPVTRQGTEHVRQLYDQYVRHRTMQDWKFWILGLILEPLLTSYTASVSSASLEELRRTAFLWVDQHCSLIDLRPAVSNKLKYLSMKTDILSDPPSTLKDEVAKAVYNSSGHHPNLHGT